MITKKISLILALAFGVVSLVNPATANAVTASDFQAGRIIDDAVFYNGAALPVGDVQSFLNSKVPSCDTYHSETTNPRDSGQPYICLKDFRQNTAAVPGDAYCNGLTAGNKSAAEIIHEAGQSCGISQKALLVLLERESALVTDSWPWQVQYNNAMGFACPDTMPCDPQYAGFASQVYNAARLFKRYAQQPNLFPFKANRTANIQYNPNPNCGSSAVFIQNNATAGLYTYTPYQPNAASLNNLYGAGDGCSAYGIRNFWRMYNDWFGSTYAPQLNPKVSLKINNQANPEVPYGSNITVSWESENVSSCLLNPGNMTGLSGSTVVNAITEDAAYAITCTGPYGNAEANSNAKVLPPTIEFLQSYLKSSAENSGMKTANIQGTLNQLQQAGEYLASGNKTEAESLLLKTVSSVNKLAEKDRLQQQFAAGYQKAAGKLINSWNAPPPVVPQPVVNGGYPSKWADPAKGSVIDSWGMYNRYSVSYAAFKVAQSGRHMPYWGGRGNANQWDDNARAAGIPVDGNPLKGDVLIINSGMYGHAMYVEDVNPDGSLKVSHYDYDLQGNYREQIIAPNAGFVYIHFPY